MPPDCEISSPKPSALIEWLRSLRYSLSTAIADILDNSIAAHARNIWIDFHWASPDSRVSVVDDGDGMSAETLAAAMRPGSANPLDPRKSDDLGRLGLGLKTASFSQCRRLTVWSRQGHEDSAGRCWDFDYVAKHDEWRLRKVGPPRRLDPFSHLGSPHRGTLVLWEQLDRTVDKAPASSREACKVRPWSPFRIEGAPASAETPLENMNLGGHSVAVRGYVLPHKDRLTET
jgi:Histidine kinase-, DNA gyrase B-, and HSP90-like ATPase